MNYGGGGGGGGGGGDNTPGWTWLVTSGNHKMYCWFPKIVE